MGVELEERADLRGRLDQVLDGITDDFLRQVVEDLFSMTKLRWGSAEVECKKCGATTRRRVQIDSPDYRGIAAALATLMDQGKGKPKEAAPAAAANDEQMRQLIREELRRALEHDAGLTVAS